MLSNSQNLEILSSRRPRNCAIYCGYRIGSFSSCVLCSLWLSDMLCYTASAHSPGWNVFIHPADIRMTIYCMISEHLHYESVAAPLCTRVSPQPPQILFMVGCGFLRPDPVNARKDTPKAFKQLCYRCCQFKKEDRPLFPQVRVILEFPFQSRIVYTST